MANDPDELARLRAENARLVALLESHGIDWRPPTLSTASPTTRVSEESALATDEKVALFRRLFRGRTDVYPVRWESARTGKSGYAPACAHEWQRGLCEKPRIKCADCEHRRFLPVTDAVVYDHLAGKHTIGVYPLLSDDTCHFLAVDFDKDGWQDDARAFVASCRALGVPAALEISRSGNGAHAWIFFSTPIMARDARRLGSALISHTCAQTRQLALDSYDRLFPNQDTLPKGGFGNLIALPLQKAPRERGHSVFVDGELHPHRDQWGYLASVEPMKSDLVLHALRQGRSDGPDTRREEGLRGCNPGRMGGPDEKTMKQKRKLFDELMEGIDAMRAQREGKITLRSHEVEELPPLEVDADLIRDTRERLHVSRAVFARRLRVSTRTLENWEQGRARPNAQAAALILMVRQFPDTLDKLSELGHRTA